MSVTDRPPHYVDGEISTETGPAVVLPRRPVGLTITHLSSYWSTRQPISRV